MTDEAPTDEAEQRSRAARLAILRECQDRVLEREGIPMVLALVNEVGPPPTVDSDAVRAEGARLAEAVDAYRAALVPSSRDDDLGCLISVLQAVSFEDFAGGDQQLEPDDVELASLRVDS